MNLILFGLILVLFTFNANLSGEHFALTVDLLPDFLGYLILWLCLDKRRINKRMYGLYTASAVLLSVTFLCFVGQVKGLFIEDLVKDVRNTGWLILDWALNGLSTLSGPWNSALLLAATLILGWLFFAMLGYWEQTNQHKPQCNICKIGMGLCGMIALCDILDFIIILPFSWHWISYPITAIALAAAWFVMKDCQEMLTGAHQPVEGRTFGKKK